MFQWMNDHWEQIGITAFTTDMCEGGSPIVYTRVAYYHDWIETHIHNESSTTEISTTEASPHIYHCDKHAVPCGCGRRNVQFTSSKSIHINEAIPYSWSMIVSIRSNGTNKHSCSGTILSESYILTSASCIADVPSSGITIAAGIHNRLDDEATYRKVDSMFLHPDYTGISDNFSNDIAILHISQPLNFDNDQLISRTCLTEIDESLPDVIYYPLSGARLAMIGWGYTDSGNSTSPDILQQAEVYATVALNRNCNVMNTHRDIKFCAETEDGGPGYIVSILIIFYIVLFFLF
jgi:secreted trypsin-like serine protease